MSQRFHFLLILLIGVFLALGSFSGAFAAMTPTTQQQQQTVQTLEDTLFGVRYDQEAMADRLSRLESTVFGQPQSKLSVEERISKLQGALSPSSLGALSPLSKPTATPVSDKTGDNAGKSSSATKNLNQPLPNTAAAQPEPNGNVAPSAAQAKPAPGETDYPTVSQMEQKVFGKTFVQEDITNRLARLEKRVFQTVQRGALADRVDNLRLMVLGDTGNNNNQAATSQAPTTVYRNPASAPYPVPQPASSQYSYSSSSTTGPYPVPYPPNRNAVTNPYPVASGYPGYPGTPVASATPASAYGTQPYYGQSPLGNDPYGDPGGDPYGSAPPAYNSNASPVTADTEAAVSEVEKEVLGHTYPAEPMSARLDRLETKIFHATSPEMSPDDRIQRVIAVASAGGAPQSPQAKAKTTMQVLLPIILTILPLVLL